jgi:hypothetical protein
LKEGGTSFTFVTDGVGSAVERARAVAGGKNVARGRRPRAQRPTDGEVRLRHPVVRTSVGAHVDELVDNWWRTRLRLGVT